MRISDWSSDVCSSDLADIRHHRAARFERGEVNRLAIEDIGFLAHEDRVAVPSHRRRPRSERHRLPRAVVGEQVRGEHLAASAEAAIRLLQADDIGIDLAQYVERAIGARSEEGRVGKEGVSTVRTWWSP